MMLSATT